MHQRRLLWLTAALVTVTLIALWRVRAARSLGAARTPEARQLAARAAQRDPRFQQVLELLKKKDDAKSWTELVALYGRLAGDPSALAVRRSVLNALFSEPALPLRLKRVLDAVEADPTPAPQDPLWPEIAHGLAEAWSSSVFDRGRDLMVMEKRPRAQRALIASFIELTASPERLAALAGEQSQGLLVDLIDLHARAERDQRPQIEEAVRRLGGNDPADLLAGHGLGEGKKLELQAQYERNLQVGIDTLLKDQPVQATP